MTTCDKRLIALHPNGTFTTVVFFKGAMFKGETEDEFINREVARLNQDPEFEAAPKFIFTKQQFLQAISQQAQKNRRAMLCDQSGNLTVNESYKSEKDLKTEAANELKQKLASSLNLTNEEADLLIK